MANMKAGRVFVSVRHFGFSHCTDFCDDHQNDQCHDSKERNVCSVYVRVNVHGNNQEYSDLADSATAPRHRGIHTAQHQLKSSLIKLIMPR